MRRSIVALTISASLASLVTIQPAFTATLSVRTSTPVISNLSPASGPVFGGNCVTITGSGFESGVTVTFGSNTAVATYVSSSQIDIDMPPGTEPVAADVTVTNPDGGTTTATGAYTYFAETITP